MFNPDEATYVEISQQIFKTGDLNPHFFRYPTLFLYINAVAYIPYYLIGNSLGFFENRSDIPSPQRIAMGTGIISKPSVFLLGRFVSALFGIGAILLFYFALLRLTRNPYIGLFSALLLAISPTAIISSHYISPDTFVVFFGILTFWATILVFQEGKLKYYILAGIAGGLTASSKYNGALFLIPLIIVHFMRYKRAGFKNRKNDVALIAAGLAFLVTTPYSIFEFDLFFKHLLLEARHYSKGHPGSEGNTLFWYFRYLLSHEGIVLILAVIEITIGFIKKNRQSILTALFFIIYFVFISRFVVRNERTLLPALPYLFVLTAIFISSIWKSIIKQKSRIKYIGFICIAILISLVVIPQFVQSIKTNMNLTRIDSRITAVKWIEENIPEGAKIALESYSPYVDTDKFDVKGFFKLIDQSPEWFTGNEFHYLIFSQGMFQRFFDEPLRYKIEVESYNNMFKCFTLIKVFTNENYEVRIYKTQ